MAARKPKKKPTKLTWADEDRADYPYWLAHCHEERVPFEEVLREAGFTRAMLKHRRKPRRSV